MRSIIIKNIIFSVENIIFLCGLSIYIREFFHELRKSMKSKKNKITYIQTFCNCIINICFIAIFISIGLCIYQFICFGFRYIPNISSIYGNLISAFVTILLAIISYITKAKKSCHFY